MLKLFYRCQLMYNENDDVSNGVANGTTALFKKVVLKQGRTPHKICYNGYWVYAVNAEDVEYMQLQWTPDSAFQGTFTLAPKSVACRSVMKIESPTGKQEEVDIAISLQQFRVLVNHATTGHKLQGKSVDSLLIRDYASIKNWVYVVLSRVRKLKDLYLMKKLPENETASPDSDMMDMMSRLRDSIMFRGDSETIKPLRLRCSADTEQEPTL